MSTFKDNNRFPSDYQIPLKRKIKRRGCIYTRLLEGSNHYLYEQKERKSGVIMGYMVFKKRIRPEFFDDGTIIPAMEIFPSEDEITDSVIWKMETIGVAINILIKVVKQYRHAEEI